MEQQNGEFIAVNGRFAALDRVAVATAWPRMIYGLVTAAIRKRAAICRGGKRAQANDSRDSTESQWRRSIAWRRAMPLAGTKVTNLNIQSITTEAALFVIPHQPKG